jgi:hypothetical protein
MISLVGNSSHDRWYPNPVDNLRKHFSIFEFSNSEFKESNLIISNICYNLQYLEYLRKTLNELNLSSVLLIQTIKTYIINSISIIEACFFMILIKEGHFKKCNYYDFKKLNNTYFKIEEEKFCLESKILKRSDNGKYKKPTFDQMIKRIESKKILKIDNQFFSDLNHLRKLRNKIHLQEIDKPGKSDYSTFWKPEYNLAKKNLYLFLICEYFKSDYYDIDLFSFLKVSEL